MRVIFPFVIMLFLLGGSSLKAEDTVPKSSLTPLIQLLENDEHRKKLIEKLKHEVEEEEPSEVSPVVQPVVEYVIDKIKETFQRFKNDSKITLMTLSDPHRLEKGWDLFLIYGGVLGLGFAFTFLMHFLKRFRTFFVNDHTLTKTKAILVSLAFEGVTLLGFTIVTFTSLHWLSPSEKISASLSYLLVTIINFRIIQALLSTALYPHSRSFRLLPLKDGPAHLLERYGRHFFNLQILSYILGSYLLNVGRLDTLVLFSARLFWLIIGYLTLALIKSLKNSITAALRLTLKYSKKRNVFEVMSQSLIRYWYPLSLAYVMFFVFLFTVVEESRFKFLLSLFLKLTVLGIGTYLLFLRIPSIMQMIVRSLGQTFNIPYSRQRFYEIILSVLFYTILVFTFLYLLCKSLQIPLTALFSFLETEQILPKVISVVITALIGLVVLESLEFIINKVFRQLGKSSNQKNLPSLLTLIQHIIRVVIFILTLLMVFSELGFNITPLLASAGVFGLAVSLGSQTLFNDVIKGFFILTEDTINIGDRVTINLDHNKHSGVVEDLTLRNVKLRDTQGFLHTIPFSTIGAIVNESRHP